jgi:hypothetical protein
VLRTGDPRPRRADRRAHQRADFPQPRRHRPLRLPQRPLPAAPPRPRRRRRLGRPYQTAHLPSRDTMTSGRQLRHRGRARPSPRQSARPRQTRWCICTTSPGRVTGGSSS